MKKQFIHTCCAGLALFALLTSCKKIIQDTSSPDIAKELLTLKTDTNFISRDSALVLATRTRKYLTSYSKKSLSATADIAESVQNFTVYDQQKVPAAYAVNYSGSGFAIISADKRLPAILAFSDEGHLDTAHVPLGFNRWLTVLRDSVNFKRYASANAGSGSGGGTTPVSSADPGLGTLNDAVNPILQSYWGQGSGFNDNCPIKNCSLNNGKALAGCVAIAIGQVMYKNQYPSSYSWASMSPYTGTSEAARLIRDIGDNVGMDYGCDGSGADGDKTLNCLNSYNYNVKSVDYDPEWGTPAPVMLNLKAGRPIILTGGKQGKTWLIFNTYDDGHEWVCDGYKQYTKLVKVRVGNPRDGFHLEQQTRYFNYYHMNWGWYGSYNGYFSFGNFVPGAPDIEGSPDSNLNFSFNYKVKVFYDIAPRI
ncbi:C10 family peptidase [Mucilaginibacter paludis]|nr:C10 family peptidase [Mucilaginibacter paludis]